MDLESKMQLFDHYDKTSKQLLVTKEGHLINMAVVSSL